MKDDAPSENELHAFADGQLADSESRRVADWLEGQPEAADRVAAWQRQNAGLRALFAGSAESLPGDAALVAAYSRRRAPFLRVASVAAAALMVFAAGAVAGRYLPLPGSLGDGLSATADLLPREAGSAYLIYASEVRHPVEVGADQEAHLVAWLGKRLDHPLATPDLGALGYHLVGGRLVPANGKSGALFMYENDAGERVTLLIGQDEGNRRTSFRYATDGPVETFYWIDGRLGYAVTAQMPRASLQAIATEIYSQLYSGPEGGSSGS